MITIGLRTTEESRPSDSSIAVITLKISHIFNITYVYVHHAVQLQQLGCTENVLNRSGLATDITYSPWIPSIHWSTITNGAPLLMRHFISNAMPDQLSELVKEARLRIFSHMLCID